MSITEFASLVRRRLVLIVAIALLVGGAVAVWTLRSPTEYEATATLYVSVSGTPAVLPVELPEELEQAIEEARRQADEDSASPQAPLPPSVQVIQPDVEAVSDVVIDSYAELAQSAALLARAADRLEDGPATGALDGQVTVTHPPQSQLIDVTARDRDPERAAEIATAVGREVSRSVRRWESEPGIGSPVRIAVADPASVPESAASPRVARNIIFGIVVGLALGLAAAIVREIFDTRLREPAAVRDQLDLPVLATIDFDRRLRAHSLLLHQGDLDQEEIAQERLAEIWSRSRVAEEFRQLRVNLQFISFDGAPRSIAVTSSRPGEGKTTTAGNLAITLALAGEAVALVDCDLRNPSVHRALEIDGGDGLTDVLIGQADLDSALVSGRRLSVLTAGSLPPNPTELLGSQAMADLLDELHRRYGVVIVDTPPALPFADPAVVAPLCGATLLVVRIDHTRVGELERAASTLRAVDARICGTVVNMVKSRSLRRSSQYYSYYYSDGHRDRAHGALSGSGFGDFVPRAVNGRPGAREPSSDEPARGRLES